MRRRDFLGAVLTLPVMLGSLRVAEEAQSDTTTDDLMTEYARISALRPNVLSTDAALRSEIVLRDWKYAAPRPVSVPPLR